MEGKVLITGASSGLGRDIARELDKKGYELILVARNKEKLVELKKELNPSCEIIVCDLSVEANCIDLYESTKDKGINTLINNAGFGEFGDFVDTDLEKEIEMIKTNDIAPHILMKLFLKDFEKQNKGNILNVCSVASFYPGPLMATYYATKSYLYRLSLAIQKELEKKKSKVVLSVFCPGPIATNFQNQAHVKFTLAPLSSEKAAYLAVKTIEKNKKIMIPTFKMKCAKFFSHFVSDRMLATLAYHFQKNKR